MGETLPQTQSQLVIKKDEKRHFDTPIEFVDNYIENESGSSVVEKKKIEKGVANEVYLIKNKSGQEFISRISLNKDNNRFEEEKWSIEQCKDAGVPVPEVLLTDKIDIKDKIYNICIESKLPGVALYEEYNLTEEEKNKILNQVGQILSQIHSVPIDGFGKFDKNGKGEFSSVEDILKDPYIRDEKMLNIAKEISLDEEIIKKALEIVKNGSALCSKVKPKLVHNDFVPKHILIENKEITGIIDFEIAVGGDPVIDLARWHILHQNIYNVEEIIKGYENQEVFQGNYDKRFNLWRIYLVLMDLAFQYQEKNQQFVEFNKQELINDVTYYNEVLSQK